MRLLSFVLLSFIMMTTQVFAWDSVGHRLVAQIAYDQLTRDAKTQVDALTAVQFHSKYPDARFGRASTWPDTIHIQSPEYNAWHYIDIPYVQGNLTPPPIAPQNVVWAIQQAEKIVSDPTSTPAQRALYLSFLIHCVGDIHQPMHTITLVSAQFPKGDRGGNLYPIQAIEAKNLHAYWDVGLGYFYHTRGSIYAFHYDQIQAMATEWINTYPRSFFAGQLTEKTPMQWAEDSHALAIKYAYTTPENAVPSHAYVMQGQSIVKQQIVLAGYRLADILNTIFERN
jgi:hypothetical protein